MPLLDPIDFHSVEVPRLLAGHEGALAAVAAPSIGPLVLEVDGNAWTYRRDGDTLVVDEGADAAVHVVLSIDAFADLVASMRTVITLHLAGDIEYRRGTFAGFARWEGALRALYLGIPAYDPARVTLPPDLDRTFDLGDADWTMANFLHETGYLHIRGVLDPNEVADLTAEASRIETAASRDDPLTWWADRADGTAVLCRVVYAQRFSDLIARLCDDPRMLRLASLLGSPVEIFPDRMDGPTLLFKPPGKLAGLANLPWHQDCGLGGHPIICPSVSIGIQITGSTLENGCFRVIAGSHGQSVIPGLDDAAVESWPRVDVPTAPGDVTIHISDVVHASPPPRGTGGRRTLYLTYHPPTLADHIGPGAAINDFIRGRQTDADALQTP